MSEPAHLRRLPDPPVVGVATLERGLATGWVTVDDAARYLGMGRRFVEELIAKREIPSYKFGRSRRTRLSDLEEWARRRKEI